MLAIPMPAIEDVKERQTKVAFVEIGGVELEVTQGYSEAAMKTAKERGDTISHFCLTTKDIVADIATLKQRGVAFRDEKPRVGLTKKWIAHAKMERSAGLGSSCCSRIRSRRGRESFGRQPLSRACTLVVM